MRSLFLFSFLLALPAHAANVFYQGDPNLNPPNGGNFLDCHNCRGSGVFVYDNFSISTAMTLVEIYGSWHLLTTNQTLLPTSAYWAIRTGISQGNDGTLVADGFASLSTSVTPPLDGLFGRAFFTGTIAGLNLTLSPGTYWLTISPAAIDTGSGELFLNGTNGAGALNGTLDGQSYVRGPYWSGMQNVGSYLQPFTGRSTYDFSYGARGEAVPEPATVALSLTGLALILRRRARHTMGAWFARDGSPR